MVGVSKIYPPQKQVLKNIYLSFFYGAKIGIIGLNGSGKSTLMRIIAGIDKEYQGEVVFCWVLCWLPFPRAPFRAGENSQGSGYRRGSPHYKFVARIRKRKRTVLLARGLGQSRQNGRADEQASRTSR